MVCVTIYHRHWGLLLSGKIGTKKKRKIKREKKAGRIKNHQVSKGFARVSWVVLENEMKMNFDIYFYPQKTKQSVQQIELKKFLSLMTIGKITSYTT